MSRQRDPISAAQIGVIGERLARTHLEAAGYRVAAANYHCRWGEIDLIARDGDDWVFVEVRTRRGSSHGEPEETLTEAKAGRIILAAQHYLSEVEGLQAEPSWRIDLVAVRLGPGRRVLDIHHVKHAVSG